MIQPIDLITVDPNVREGRPCIAGTGIRVIDIAMAHLVHRRTPEELGSDYGLSLAQVHAAIAFYYQHKSDLDEDIRVQIITARNLKEQNIGGSSLL